MKKTIKKSPKSETIKVITICSVCGEPVCATKKYLAYRHGFNRYRTKRTTSSSINTFSQEDDKACEGSGKAVVYKRKTNQ